MSKKHVNLLEDVEISYRIIIKKKTGTAGNQQSQEDSSSRDYE